MRIHTFTGVVATMAGLAVLWGSAAAQPKTPASADFDACNRQARMQVERDSGTGSALPRQDLTSPGAPSTPGPGSADPPTAPGAGPRSDTGPSDTSMDPTIVGIDPTMRADTLYLAAYQDCMRARGH
jgi:hypothetical protein